MSLEIHNLTKKYKFAQDTQTLFENLNIVFPEHGIVSIIGESGCGKTTLLHILAGIEKNYDGEVLINNQNIRNIKNYNRDYISLIYQNYRLFDFLNVYENCVIYNKIKGIKYHKDEVDHYLQMFDLERERNKKINELSGGQKQRVAIIRSLLSKCPIILCDEPTGALNDENKEKVYKYLKSYSKNHLIIIVSHDTKIQKYSHYVIDFHHLKHHYDFSSYKYQRYTLKLIKKKYSLFKESLKMLFQQKNKLLMIFLSQIFIFVSITMLITGINGMELHYKTMKEMALNNNMVTIKKKNNQPFKNSEIEQLKGSYHYLLDIGKIKGVDYFQSFSIDKKLKKNEIIINQALYKKIKAKKLTYRINHMSFEFSVKNIIDDGNKEPVLYFCLSTIPDEIKLITIDLSTCIVYLENYSQIKSFIKHLNQKYEGYCLVEEEYDAYHQLMKLCKTVGFIFIILGIIIVIILMFFILLSMFFELQKYYVVFLSNGMSYSQYLLFLLKKILIICFNNSILSSLFCVFIIKLINYFDISKNIFGISKIFIYPVFVFSIYDIYIIYITSYFFIGFLLFLIMFRQLKIINMIEVLRED